MTRLLPSTPASVDEVVRLLRAGEVVGLPTETVYGLAADATNPAAVAKIFEAKERPFFDPLIVHLPDRKWLHKVTECEDVLLNVTELADAFWPGPLTMILPRSEMVPDLVTSGLDTVAVRLSAHPLFGEVARALGRPLAAPSANRFGRISPTTAAHVVAELDGRIPAVLDGGPCAHGLESTIIAVHPGKLRLLRAGPITREELEIIAPVEDARPSDRPEAPGQLASHYAPRTPMRLVGNIQHSTFNIQHPMTWRTKDAPAPSRVSFEQEQEQEQEARRAAARPLDVGCWMLDVECFPKTALLAFRSPPPNAPFAAIEVLSPTGDLREAAATLFSKMRRLDESGVELILAEPVPETGLGVAIMDRLRKATHV